jgi:hypothetical protein
MIAEFSHSLDPKPLYATIRFHIAKLGTFA